MKKAFTATGLIYLVLILAILSITACGTSEINKFCGTYQRGFAYASVAITALDTLADSGLGSALDPTWLDRYTQSKDTLLKLNESLLIACEAVRNDGEFDRDEIRNLLAQSTGLVIQIIDLYRSAQNDGSLSIPRDTSDLDSLYAELHYMVNNTKG